MTAYLSMIVWIFICKLLELSLNGHALHKISSSISWRFAFFSISYIILIVGLRNGVGDTPAYIQMFNDLPNHVYPGLLNQFSKDKGFFLLSTIFRQFISTDFHLWLLTIAVISGTCIAIALKRYSEDYFLSLLLFLLTIQFVWLLNGIRQFIVVSIFFANQHLIVQRKTIRFLILALLLSTIHITALIMIPIYFICTYKPWTPKMLLASTIILAAGLSIDKFASLFSFALEDSAYSGYINTMISSSGSDFLRFLVAAAPPVFALICRRYVAAADDPFINVAVNMSVFSAICYYIATIFGGILIGRIPIYFDVYNLILLPWLIHHSFEKRSQPLMIFILLVLYSFFYYFKMIYGLGMDYYSDIITFFSF